MKRLGSKAWAAGAWKEATWAKVLFCVFVFFVFLFVSLRFSEVFRVKRSQAAAAHLQGFRCFVFCTSARSTPKG